jgi:outer membrane protein assembly factor BamB
MNPIRMGCILAMTCLLAGGAAVMCIQPADETARRSTTEASVDTVAAVREWNSDKFGAPPTTFRQGHVTPRPLDEKALTKNDHGYTIKLPSGAPIPTPSVYDGKLYVSGGFHSKEFYCFNAENGKLVWGLNLDDDGPTAAACDDGVIVVNTESCTIFALDAASGKLLWSYWLGDPLTSTPTIAGGRVFTSYPASDGGQVPQGQLPPKKGPPAANAAGQAAPAKTAPPCSHVLAAFDLKTGKILWQRWIDSDVMSTPVAIDGELYVTSFGGTVYKFKQADGTIVSATRSRATSAPVVVGKNVYYTKRVDDGKGKAEEAIAGDDRTSSKPQFQGDKKDALYLDPRVQQKSQLKVAAGNLDAGNGFAGGAPASANPAAALGNIGQDNVCTMQAFQGSRLLNYGNRNFNCMGNEVICSDPENGKALWTVKLKGDLEKEGGFMAAPPAAAGGQLFLTTLQGNVLQMDPASGRISHTYKVGSPLRFQPAIEGGRIYVGTQDGKVVCLDTGNRKLTGWPCWGGNPAHTGLAQKPPAK